MSGLWCAILNPGVPSWSRWFILVTMAHLDQGGPPWPVWCTGPARLLGAVVVVVVVVCLLCSVLVCAL